jgi:antitoxin (DNA-binding transcriptional repressor) of toxin-antitoxin stability system
MRTEVRIAEFKSHLSRYLRAAQKGAEIVIKDRDTPIARLVPHTVRKERLISRPPIGSLKDIDELPTYAPPGLTWKDVEEALKEERRERMDDLL